MKYIRYTTRGIALGLGLTLAACATPPAPRTLVEAQSKLASKEAERLSASRPALVKEARRLEAEATRAWKQGHLEEAELKGAMALQKYSVARDFEARDAALSRLSAMGAAVEDINTEVERLGREESALARFQQADAAFRAVEGQLATMREDDTSAQAQARRDLLKARQKQAEAIGKGAPNAATGLYNEGRLLLDTGLEALSGNLFAEAKSAASQAIDKFDAAIAASADSDEAQRRKAREGEESSNKEGRLRAEAQSLIDEAQTAKASAIAQRMPEKDAAAFEKASYLLDLATARLKDNQLKSAAERATESRDIFKGAELGAGTPRAKAESAIAKAEEARARIIGMGLGQMGATQQADYNLNIAKQSLGQQQYERAQRLAEEAAKDFDGIAAFAPRLGLGGPQGFAGQPGGAQGNTFNFGQGGYNPYGQANPYQTPQRPDRDLERVIVRVQVERAEALGAQKDKTCPGTWSEFEALLQLSESRLKAGDTAQAVEFAVRASERLKKCGAPAPGAKVPGAAGQQKAPGAVAEAEKPPAPAELRAQAGAQTALAAAQREFIKIKALKPDPERLEAPAMLMANALQWYEREAWLQSKTMADEAVKLLADLERDTRNPAAVGQKDAPKTAVTPAKKAECKGFDGKMLKVRVAQGSAGAQVSGQQDETRYRRGISLALSSQKLADNGQCQEAEAFLSEASLIFEDLTGRTDDKAPAVIPPAARVEAPKTACKALDPKLGDALTTQNIAAGRVKTKTEETRVRQGAQMLRLAEEMANKGQCVEAENMMKGAIAVLNTIPANTNTPAAKDKTPGDKPPVVDKTPGDKTPVDKTPAPGVDPQARADAMEAMGRARVLKASRSEQSSSNVYITGSRLLLEAGNMLAQGRPLDATRLAQQATYAFETLPAEVDPDNGGGGGTAPLLEEPWKPAYQQILDALILRDRAKDAIGSKKEEDTFKRGKDFMSSSQRTWEVKDYLAARRFAKAATDDFETVLKMAAERKIQEDKAAQDKAARDKAMSDKDKALSDKDKALSDKDKALSDKDKAMKEAEARRKRQEAAASALSDAEVQAARCNERDCKKLDASRFIQATAQLKKARKALDEGDFDTAETNSASAIATFKTLLSMKPVFSMPTDAKYAKLVGNKVVLNPRLTFQAGGTKLTPNSQASLRELADILKANADGLSRVDLVGFTDNSGNARNNLDLSKRRAEAVRAELIGLGVPAAMLVADGKGIADPIASNNTPQGRALNRRVEIVLTVKR